MAQDYRTVARELLRALRGKRSQTAHSRRLGFKSNVAAEWESGRRSPSAAGLVKACARLRIDLTPAFQLGPLAALKVRPTSARGVAEWLEALRAGAPIHVVAERAGLSRYQVARFLRGQNEPRLHQFLALVDACTGRLVDFVSRIVDIERVPSLLAASRRLAASRTLAFQHPAASAILAAIDVRPDLSRQRIAAHLAHALELELEKVQSALEALELAGVVTTERNTLKLGAPLLIDTAGNREAASVLRRHWAEVAARRAAKPRPGDTFSHNVFSVSGDDYRRIRQLQTDYYQQVRAIVRESKPEIVALLNVQLMHWNVGADVDVVG